MREGISPKVYRYAIANTLRNEEGETAPVAELSALGVVGVFAAEQFPGDMPGPVAITVSTGTGDIEEWQYNVRIYAILGAIKAEDVEDVLDDIKPVIEDLLGSEFGAIAWSENVYVEQLTAVIASATVVRGRDDL